MAPIEQYLMDRDAEIVLARSAVPDAISHDASVIVLTRHGYETTVQGKNGWVCWVGRGWMAMFDHPEFWNPKVRAAECINPPVARSVLPYAYKRSELLLAGHFQARSHRHRAQERNGEKAGCVGALSTDTLAGRVVYDGYGSALNYRSRRILRGSAHRPGCPALGLDPDRNRQ
jgi:hypothetical protein